MIIGQRIFTDTNGMLRKQLRGAVVLGLGVRWNVVQELQERSLHINRRVLHPAVHQPVVVPDDLRNKRSEIRGQK